MKNNSLPTLPKTTYVVGLGSKARVGKNTLADMLQEIFYPRLRVRQYSFARALYDYCRVNYGMTTKDPELLQRVGVEKRETDPDIWVRTVAWQIMTDAPDIAIITDVRFQNEAGYVSEQGGLVARVTRYNADGTLFVAPDRPADHPSEVDLDHYRFGHEVTNDLDMAELFAEALDLATIVAFSIAGRRSCGRVFTQAISCVRDTNHAGPCADKTGFQFIA